MNQIKYICIGRLERGDYQSKNLFYLYISLIHSSIHPSIHRFIHTNTRLVHSFIHCMSKNYYNTISTIFVLSCIVLFCLLLYGCVFYFYKLLYLCSCCCDPAVGTTAAITLIYFLCKYKCVATLYKIYKYA